MDIKCRRIKQAVKKNIKSLFYYINSFLHHLNHRRHPQVFIYLNQSKFSVASISITIFFELKLGSLIKKSKPLI